VTGWDYCLPVAGIVLVLSVSKKITHNFRI